MLSISSLAMAPIPSTQPLTSDGLLAKDLLPLLTAVMGALAVALWSWTTQFFTHKRDRRIRQEDLLREAYLEWVVQLEDILQKMEQWHGFMLLMIAEEDEDRRQALREQNQESATATSQAAQKLSAARVRLLLLERNTSRRCTITKLTQMCESKPFTSAEELLATVTEFRDKSRPYIRESLQVLLLEIARSKTLV